MIITGLTLINHNIRIKLRITANEYCIMQFLQEWHITNKKQPEISDFYKGLGVSKKDFDLICDNLKKKGLINFLTIPTELWTNHFSDPSEEFDRLWVKLPKGSKIRAQKRYNKCRKLIKFEDLESKLEAYVKYCDKFVILKKDLETWLNPETKHWDDNLYSDKNMISKVEPKQPLNKTFDFL